MGRPGRSEASGLRFDHCLEGVAAQCPLLLQVEADFEAKGTEVINRIDCLAPLVALRTAPAVHPFRVGWPRILAGQRSEGQTSELQSLLCRSSACICLTNTRTRYRVFMQV